MMALIHKMLKIFSVGGKVLNSVCGSENLHSFSGRRLASLQRFALNTGSLWCLGKLSGKMFMDLQVVPMFNAEC